MDSEDDIQQFTEEEQDKRYLFISNAQEAKEQAVKFAAEAKRQNAETALAEAQAVAFAGDVDSAAVEGDVVTPDDEEVENRMLEMFGLV